MEVFLKTVEGASHSLEVGEKTTVGNLKDMAAEETGMDRAMFTLEIMGAVRMNEDEVAAALGVCPGDEIQMAVSEWWPVKGLKTKYKIARYGDKDSTRGVVQGDIAAIDVTGIDSATGKQIWKTEGLTHTVDVGRSIVGFDKGCLGMLPGEIRCLLVPPEEGYPYGHPSLKVPPRTELIFEISYHRTIVLPAGGQIRF